MSNKLYKIPVEIEVLSESEELARDYIGAVIDREYIFGIGYAEIKRSEEYDGDVNDDTRIFKWRYGDDVDE